MAILSASACAHYSPKSVDDIWDSEQRLFNVNQICQTIPPLWILPVSAENQNEALSLLSAQEFLKLTENQFEQLSGIKNDTEINSAQSLFDNALNWLKENPKDRTYKYCSFYSGEDCVNELILLGTRPRDAKPYLIRAVVKHQNTGRFSAEECEDGVHIKHSSLGQFIPPSMKSPMIVFLSRPPNKVFSTSTVAG